MHFVPDDSLCLMDRIGGFTACDSMESSSFRCFLIRLITPLRHACHLYLSRAFIFNREMYISMRISISVVKLILTDNRYDCVKYYFLIELKIKNKIWQQVVKFIRDKLFCLINLNIFSLLT